jgi:hypothetical protein
MTADHAGPLPDAMMHAAAAGFGELRASAGRMCLCCAKSSHMV